MHVELGHPSANDTHYQGLHLVNQKSGSWEHLTGNWRETTLHVMVIQIDNIETIIVNDIQIMFSLNIVFHVNNLS